MKVLDIGKHLVVFATLLFAGMLFFPVVAAGAAVEAGTVRVVLARQTAPVNFKVNGYYQLVNQTSGKLVANIQKDESWQVHLKDGQIQFQGPDDTYGPFSGPVVIVQGEDFDLRLNIITGDKKVVEKAGSSGLMAISAGGKAVLLSENSLSARSMLGMQQLGASAGPSEGLSLVSVQVGSEYKRYRGNMEFCIEKESLAVINELNIEDYLRGVVPAEMPSSWPEEALKAQAVVARNYALQKVETSRGSSYNLTNDQLSQVYRGYDGETEATDRAVEDTRGLVLLNRGNLISTFFHSCSGGFIENSEDVWLNALPYIKTKEDPFDKNNQHYNWQVSYTNDQLTKMFKNEKHPFDQITDIEVAERTASGARAKTLVVEGIDPEGETVRCEVKNADNIRAALGLKSALFTIKKFYEEKNDSDEVENDRTEGKEDRAADQDDRTEVEDDRTENGDDRAETENYLARIEINGSGYGHGLGLSQWGAYGMAKQGYNFQDILKYYYTDVKMAGDYGRQ